MQVAAVLRTLGNGAVQMAYCALVWLGALVVARDARAISSGSGLRPSVASRSSAGFCSLVSAPRSGGPKDVLFSASAACAPFPSSSPADASRLAAAALGGFGIVGVLTSYRRPFFITDGPYVAPPMLFAFVCAAGCLARSIAAREAVQRPRRSSWLLRGVVDLAAVLFLAGFSVRLRRPDPDCRNRRHAVRAARDRARDRDGRRSPPRRRAGRTRSSSFRKARSSISCRDVATRSATSSICRDT